MNCQDWTRNDRALSAKLHRAICGHDVNGARVAMSLGADPACPYDDACVDDTGAPLTPAMQACGPNLPPMFFPVLFGTDLTEVPLALSGPNPVLLTDAAIDHCTADNFQGAFTTLLICMHPGAPVDDAIWKAVRKHSLAFRYDNPDRTDGGPALAASRAAELLTYGGMPAEISEALEVFRTPIEIKNGPPLEFAEFAIGKKGVLARFLERGFPADFTVYGMPLLHYAAYKMEATLAQDLLQAGASPDVVATPSSGARDYLRARNQDVEIPEEFNALEMAQLRGAQDVVQVIEAHKARLAVECVLAKHRSKALP